MPDPPARLCPVTRSARIVATLAGVLLLGGARMAPAQEPPARVSVEQLVEWLDHPETQWVATARLQETPQAAVAALLRPGRVVFGTHNQWTAPMLALAKLGEPAIPAVRDRLLTIVRKPDSQMTSAAEPLVTVLASLGPRAIPALVQVAEADESTWISTDALDAIVRIAPRTSAYGQEPSPWIFWQAADDRPGELERQLVPLLPRVQQVMDRAIKAWKPQRPAPQRPAAYLLARWGTDEMQARGRQVLVDLAMADEPFYRQIESVRLLHALRAPETAALIRSIAGRVPVTDDLRGLYFLEMATALYQLGDRGYGDLVDVPLHDSRADVRMDAVRFLASTGDAASVMRIQPLLEDRAEWNRQSVASVAAQSLQRASAEWKSRAASVADVPIGQATKWLDDLDPANAAGNLPMIDAYLRRPDLDAGPTGGGTGPVGAFGPRVVTLLLAMVQRSVPGAMAALEQCLGAASASVRVYGALALSAYDKPRAVEALAQEAASTDAGRHGVASEFLLQLGDARGFPARLDAFESDQEAVRLFACRDLRSYSQLTLACDASAGAAERAVQLSAWRAWWHDNGAAFRVRTREAALDLKAFPLISPVSIGGRPVR